MARHGPGRRFLGLESLTRSLQVSLPTAPSRILLLAGLGFGDAARALPLVSGSITATWPDAALTMTGPPRVLELTRMLPAFDHDRVIETPPALAAVAQDVPSERSRFSRWRTAVRAARRERFDLVIDLVPAGAGPRWFARLLRARSVVRIALRDRHRSIGRERTTTDASAEDAPITGSQWWAALRAQLEQAGLRPHEATWMTPASATSGETAEHTSAISRHWEAFAERHRLADRSFTVLVPGSRWASKRWPADRWKSLAEPLLQRGFERIVLLGRDADDPSLAALRVSERSETDESFPIVDLIGKTDGAMFLALIARCGLVVAGDTAALHVAAACNRPWVGLFGPTDPAVAGPVNWRDGAVRGLVPGAGEIISATDPKIDDRLMRLISVPTVLRQIDEVLARQSVSRAAVASSAAGESAPPVPHAGSAGGGA